MSYSENENMWDEQWPRIRHEGADEHPAEEPGNLDEELGYPEEVGTTEVMSAVRDSEPYMAPTEPPVLPGGPEGVHVATGFGTNPEEEQYGVPLPRGDFDIQDEVMIILRQDSDTSTLNLDVDVDSGVVYLRGQVPDAEAADRASNLITEYVRGVVDVVDETTIVPAVAE